MADAKKAARARELLARACKATERLEDTVRELVTMRAWEELGYENFSQMWEMEHGLKCPMYVQILAVGTLRLEGLSSTQAHQAHRRGAGGYPHKYIAQLIGMPISTNPKTGVATSAMASKILVQLAAGVPAAKVTGSTTKQMRKIIEQWGTRPSPRSRAHPRRGGKACDELVSESFLLVKRDAEAIKEIALQANIPRSELYRQLIAEYLQRHRASRPKKSA